MLDYITFLTCLEFAVLNSLYQETTLKPKQVVCLENVYLQKDVMCVLPTGYGKSLIFLLLPMLLFAKSKMLDHVRLRGISAAAVNSMVVVVSPLNSLMSNQLSRLRISGVRAAVINVKELRKEHTDHETDLENENMEIEIDFRLCEERKLRDGHYHIVFAHPETLVSSKYGRDLLLSETYQEHVIAIAVGEAHCIVEWLVSHSLYIKQSSPSSFNFQYLYFILLISDFVLNREYYILYIVFIYVYNVVTGQFSIYKTIYLYLMIPIHTIPCILLHAYTALLGNSILHCIIYLPSILTVAGVRTDFRKDYGKLGVLCASD